MQFLNEKLLSEGLFGPSLQEVSYTEVMEQFKKMNKHLSDALDKTTACKLIKTYNEKEIFPNFFAISKKDYRMTIQQYASEPFSIFDLARKSELTENIVIRELNSIFDEINYAYKDLSITFIKSQDNLYRFYIYLDFKKCLKDVLFNKSPKIEISAKEMVNEFKNNKDNVILNIKKHYLGKYLRFDKSYNSQIFKYQAASGSGLCYCLQDQTNGFISKDFEKVSPTLSPWSISMNLLYNLEETILKNTNISLSMFSNKNGSFSLWLVSKPNVKVTYQ